MQGRSHAGVRGAFHLSRRVHAHVTRVAALLDPRAHDLRVLLAAAENEERVRAQRTRLGPRLLPALAVAGGGAPFRRRRGAVVGAAVEGLAASLLGSDLDD